MVEASEYPRLLTAAEAAAELGVNSQRLRLLCRQGRIQGARKMGRDWVIPGPVERIPGQVGRPRKGAEAGN